MIRYKKPTKLQSSHLNWRVRLAKVHIHSTTPFLSGDQITSEILQMSIYSSNC